ncbi:recombinase family protein [Sutcliffiella cohnii]|uniref:recombinase family protein n=1 Tax=Sutcliffiella cohnii TaxID=33932 RepID=UPI002E1D791B|nr:recombinase family protein [Sutcliffiella cohnii]
MRQTVAIYVRSNDIKETKRQEEALYKLALEKFDNPIQFYIEKGFHSGIDINRPVLKELLVNVEEGKHMALVIKDFSRLSRNAVETIQIMNKLRDYNVGTVLEENIIQPQKSDNIHQALLDVFDMKIKEEIGSRIKTGLHKRAKSGLYSRPVYGYDLKNGILIPNPKESLIVEMVFKLTVLGRGYAYITRLLNQSNVVNKRGNSFSVLSVKRLLHNPIYAGLVKYKSCDNHEKFDMANGVHQPIITKDLWELVQKKIKNKKVVIKPRSIKY